MATLLSDYYSMLSVSVIIPLFAVTFSALFSRFVFSDMAVYVYGLVRCVYVHPYLYCCNLTAPLVGEFQSMID